MARKRNRKGRRSSKRHGSDPCELLEEGWRKIRAGDPRGALDLLKRARHGDGSLAGLDPALFCAYSARAGELAHEGGTEDAAAMRERAAGLRASIHTQTLSEPDLVSYLHWLAGAEAVQVYVQALEERPPSEAAERALADQVVAHRCWDALAAFDEEHPLRQDAGLVRGVVAKMDEGAWAEAAAALGGIGRRSPFVAWRVFCKGMACFAAGDDTGVASALKRLPVDFPLRRTVFELRRRCGRSEDGQGPMEPSPVAQLMGLRSGPTEHLAGQLLVAVGRRRVRELRRLVSDLAQALYPEDEASARVELAEILSLAADEDSRLARGLLKVIRGVLPGDRAAAVTAKLGMRVPALTGHDSPAVAAAAYCELLPAEFPTAEARELARARVLEYVACSGHEAIRTPRWLSPPSLKALQQMAGEQHAGDPDRLFWSLMRASLDADPDNRDGHRRLVSMLREGDAPYRQVEQALIAMRDRFPDDPLPCLELASHYHGRNAYRKAEAALAEARRRAPYDERILDREAVGQLKAADENRKRGNWHLVARDLERAQKLGRRRLEPILKAKWLVFDLMSGGVEALPGAQLQLEVEPRRSDPPAVPAGPRLWERLEGHTAAARLRALALAVHEIRGRKSFSAGLAADVAASTRLAEEMGVELTSAEVLDLLSPVEEDLALLFADVRVAACLRPHWSELLPRVKEENLVSAIDMLLDCDGDDAVRQELDRRLSKSENRNRLLVFCLEVVRQIQGRSVGPRRLREVAEAASPAELRQLRKAAEQLARHAPEPLRTALQRFEFELLDAPLPLFEEDPYSSPFEEPVSAADDDDEEEAAADDYLMEMLEALISKFELRDQPTAVVREVARILRASPEMASLLQTVAEAYEPFRGALSPEVHILLYPRRKDPRVAGATAS